jgi:hypothetical protein
MRPDRQSPANTPVASFEPTRRPANAKRRGFLLALGVGGAGAAAIAARSLPGVAPATDAADSTASSEGYRLTDHVKRYYQSAKI